MAADLAGRLVAVRARIATAARDAGRDPAAITLIGVSKTMSAELAAEAFREGLSDLGENRVQELLTKQEELSRRGLHPFWHLIGTLQRNKVRQVVGKTALIHSVDSADLLDEIDRRSQTAGLRTAVLLQINTSGESSKHGFTPQQTLAAARLALRCPGIRLRGLMTMAPLSEAPETSRPVFRRAADLFAEIRELSDDIAILSMGMSQDYAVAIACGATHIRLGTAIFGPRNSPNPSTT